jgi:hypothetical protein
MRIVDRTKRETKLNVLDRLIEAISPTWALRRAKARRALKAASPASASRVDKGSGWVPWNAPDSSLRDRRIGERRDRG